MASSLEDVGKSPGGDSMVSFLRVSHNDDGSLKGGGGGSGTFAALRSVTASTAALATDHQILADATSTNLTVTLPAAAGNGGLELYIQRTDSVGSHTVTVARAGADTIQGVSGSYVLRKQFGAIRLVSDGVSDWKRVDVVAPINTGMFYVDANNGNDAYPGTHPSLAKKTISAALGSYRTVNIAPGVYTETVDVGGYHGLRLIGCSTDSDDFSTAVLIQAPSSTASALKASVPTNSCEIAYLSFVGERGGGSGVYTGTVFDGTNLTIGCNIHDVGIMGIDADFEGSKTRIGSGVFGGIGLLCQNAEQAIYDNITVSNCNIGVKMVQGTTLSKLDLSHFHINQCFIAYQGYGGGDCTYRVWKMQNVFGLTFALAQLNSDGTNPADGDTVTVRDKTYRFKSTMAAANDVQIGATIDATLLSLVHAANGTGTVGTDYFTGTTRPTGVQAGWTNLVDYGASGGNGFTLDAVDTTRHACTFQVTDVLGPSGNAYVFTVSSAHLSDYFGKSTFDRAAWAFEIAFSSTWESLDAMENISLPAGNAILISGNGNIFTFFKSAPQTQMSITGNHNYFLLSQFQNTCTVQSGATGNEFHKPFPTGDGRTSTGSGNITNLGTSTVITL